MISDKIQSLKYLLLEHGFRVEESVSPRGAISKIDLKATKGSFPWVTFWIMFATNPTDAHLAVWNFKSVRKGEKVIYLLSGNPLEVKVDRDIRVITSPVGLGQEFRSTQRVNQVESRDRQEKVQIEDSGVETPRIERERFLKLREIISQSPSIELNRLTQLMDFSEGSNLIKWLYSVKDDFLFTIQVQFQSPDQASNQVTDQILNHSTSPSGTSNESTPDEETTQDYSAIFEKRLVLMKNKSFDCFHCGVTISEKTSPSICPSCKNKINTCRICRRVISYGEKVGKCTSCQTVFHLEHLLTALSLSNKCPVCQNKLEKENILLI